MKVCGYCLQGINRDHFGNLYRSEQKPQRAPKEHQGETSVAKLTSSQQECYSQEACNIENENGVIRLLQEGHFKGVADLRLRINFFDELRAAEHKELQEIVDKKITSLMELVTASIDTLTATFEFTEERTASITGYQEIFERGVNQYRDDFLSSEESSKDALVDGLNLAFEKFVTSLSSVLSTMATELTEEALSSTDAFTREVALNNSASDVKDKMPDPVPLSEPGSDLQYYLDDLRSAFVTGLEELINALMGVRVLPELSAPKGNGVAYSKFIAIYNSLQNVGKPEEYMASGQIQELYA